MIDPALQWTVDLIVIAVVAIAIMLCVDIVFVPEKAKRGKR
jgi:hypothetical protein